MAANTRVKTSGFSLGYVPSATEFNKLDTNGAGAVARLGTATGTKLLPLKPINAVVFSGSETRLCDIANGVVTCVNSAAGDLWFPLEGLPHGHVLTAVSLAVNPADGHTNEPAVLPSMVVFKVSSAGAATALSILGGAYVWSGADPTAYNAGFTLAQTSLAHTINNASYTYWLRVVLESGSDSITGMVLNSLSATCTIDHADGGADISIWV